MSFPTSLGAPFCHFNTVASDLGNPAVFLYGMCIVHLPLRARERNSARQSNTDGSGGDT